MTRRSHKKYLLVVAILGFIAFVAILKAYGRTAQEAPAATPVAAPTASLTVSVEKVRADAIPSVVTATGSVEAWQEGVISAEASNLKLTDVLVGEGDRVAKGDVLARLDSTLLTAQLAEQQAAIEQAQATLESAEAASSRAQKLLASKAISAETAEERATTVKTSRAQLAQAKAAADRIKAELAQTEIRAPFSGIISTKPAVAGSVVQTGTELMKIIRESRLEVAVLVPDKSLHSIAVGQAAIVADTSGRTIDGKVSSIAEKVEFDHAPWHRPCLDGRRIRSQAGHVRSCFDRDSGKPHAERRRKRTRLARRQTLGLCCRIGQQGRGARRRNQYAQGWPRRDHVWPKARRQRRHRWSRVPERRQPGSCRCQ